MDAFELKPRGAPDARRVSPDPNVSWGLLTQPQWPELVSAADPNALLLPGFPMGVYHQFKVKEPGSDYTFDARFAPVRGMLQEWIDHRAAASRRHEAETAILGYTLIDCADPRLQGRANYTAWHVHYDDMGRKNLGLNTPVDQIYMASTHSAAKHYERLVDFDAAAAERELEEKKFGELQDRMTESARLGFSARFAKPTQAVTFRGSQFHQTNIAQSNKPRGWVQLIYSTQPPLDDLTRTHQFGATPESRLRRRLQNYRLDKALEMR